MERRAWVFAAAEEWIIAACMNQLEITGRPCLDPTFLQSPSSGRPSDEDLVKAYHVLKRKDWATGQVARSENAGTVLHNVCLTQRAVESAKERT